MKLGTLALLGVGAWLIFGRRARAAAPPADIVDREELYMGMWRGTRADVERGIRLAEADQGVDDDRAVGILARWGDLFRRHPAPLPPQLLAVVVARESGGDPSAVSGDAILGERGLMQLSRDEAAAAGVANPMDPEQAVPGAQDLYRTAIRAFPEAGAESQLLIALLSRSIGLGDTRRLRSIVGASSAPGDTFARRVRAWLEDLARGVPAELAGRVTAEQFARRVYRACLRAEQSIVLGWVAPSSDLRVG